MDNAMINHLTNFLNKRVLAFKRDNHLETSSSVKQKTPRPSTLVFSVSRMTSFSVIIPYRKGQPIKGFCHKRYAKDCMKQSQDLN